MKTAEDFKGQAEKHGIERWDLRDCSICHYPLAYIFMNSDVFFDSGCYCTGSVPNLHRRAWQDIADHYNMQTSETYIKTMDDFWKFESE